MITDGVGRTRVGSNERDVRAGDLVFVPTETLHAIVNIGAGTLTYISAATPTFDITGLYDAGALAGPA